MCWCDFIKVSSCGASLLKHLCGFVRRITLVHQWRHWSKLPGCNCGFLMDLVCVRVCTKTAFMLLFMSTMYWAISSICAFSDHHLMEPIISSVCSVNLFVVWNLCIKWTKTTEHNWKNIKSYSSYSSYSMMLFYLKTGNRPGGREHVQILQIGSDEDTEGQCIILNFVI